MEQTKIQINEVDGRIYLLVISKGVTVANTEMAPEAVRGLRNRLAEVIGSKSVKVVDIKENYAVAEAMIAIALELFRKGDATQCLLTVCKAQGIIDIIGATDLSEQANSIAEGAVRHIEQNSFQQGERKLR